MPLLPKGDADRVRNPTAPAKAFALLGCLYQVIVSGWRQLILLRTSLFCCGNIGV